MSEQRQSRILVVDDEPALREMLVDALSDDTFEVTTAASGKEAIELAGRERIDFIVTDLLLGDCNGVDVLDALRDKGENAPAIIITGCGDVATFSEATRRRVEVMTKPLDINRLRTTIRKELSRRNNEGKLERRIGRLRAVAHSVNAQKKAAIREMQASCESLTGAYKNLSDQVVLQQSLLSYQQDLLSAQNDDDAFRTLFKLFVHNSGPLFGVAMVCNEQAYLRVIGRFGVPQPDNLKFCEKISQPVIEMVLADPKVTLFDATDQLDLFDESIRRYMVGVNVLAIPLTPAEDEMIGLTILYRKGEQPFEDTDLALAEGIARPTGVAIRRND